MKLDESQALEVIKSPKNAKSIKDIKLYESALSVFTEELDDKEIKSELYWSVLTEKMKNRSVKKFNRITQFMRFPLPIVQITDSVLNDFYKVFEGKNRYFNISTNREATALNKWVEDVNPQKWIEEQAKDVFKNKPSSIVVVDRDDKGLPYLLNINSSRLIDVDLKKDGQCEYVVFLHSKEKVGDSIFKRISVYDDASYRVYINKGGTDVYTLETNMPHGLGYCPARAFIGTSSNDKNPLKRRTAFGASLSKLEDWTIFDIFRNYVDHYVPFPVTETAVKKCSNVKCRGGKVKVENVSGEQRKKVDVWADCQVCKNKNDGALIGPGSVIKITLQGDKNKEDGSGKFKMHFPETDKMDYIPKKLDDLELEIRFKTVGISNVLQKEAVNEMQVKGSFASMESILLRTKKELDNIYKWIVSTVGNLYYINLSITVDANYGTEFYLMTEQQLQELFKEAKLIGLPREEVKSIYEQLISTKYKGNQEKVTRHKMLIDLDRFPFYSEKECIEMSTKGVISAEDLSLKVNFVRFVAKFERENTSITEFGKNLEYNDIIDKIQETLLEYNREIMPEVTPPAETPPANTPPE